jgi:hypothetical protein
VGRIFSAPGPFSRLLRNLPAITRIASPNPLSQRRKHRQSRENVPPGLKPRSIAGDNVGAKAPTPESPNEVTAQEI